MTIVSNLFRSASLPATEMAITIDTMRGAAYTSSLTNVIRAFKGGTARRRGPQFCTTDAVAVRPDASVTETVFVPYVSTLVYVAETPEPRIAPSVESLTVHA